VLSTIIPGSGRLFSGKTIPGLIWLPTVVLAYTASFPIGLFAHFVCALMATERRMDFRRGLENGGGKASCALGAMAFVVINSALIVLATREIVTL
jgi:hypothetical protein